MKKNFMLHQKAAINRKTKQLSCNILENTPTNFPGNFLGILDFFHRIHVQAYPDVPITEDLSNLLEAFVDQLLLVERSPMGVYKLKDVHKWDVMELTKCGKHFMRDETPYFPHYVFTGLLAYIIGNYGSHDVCWYEAKEFHIDFMVLKTLVSQQFGMGVWEAIDLGLIDGDNTGVVVSDDDEEHETIHQQNTSSDEDESDLIE